jgi:peptidoglycan/LPS O-acetylase OafA/YrhL
MIIRDRKQRLEFLDALRGLAAAYVVIYHTILIPHPSLVLPRWARTVAMGGYTGVTLFFMVSAFSLYFTMPLRLRDRHPTRAFYLHRFFRIAPLFYVLLIATLIRDVVLFDVTHSTFDIASSVLFVFNLVPGREPGIVWAGWTVGVEVLFYAVFPLVYRRVRSAADAITFGVFAVLGWNAIQAALAYLAVSETLTGSIGQWSVFRHLPIFGAGILTYRIYSSIDPAKIDDGQYADTGNALLASGILCYFALLEGWLPNVFGDLYYWQGIAYAGIFLGLGLSPWRLVVNRATRYLGKISYSLYLNHPTVVLILTPAYRWLYGHTPYATVSLLASVVLTFAVTVPLSILTYRLIEAPGIALGKSLGARWQAKSGGYGLGSRPEMPN